jgi:hypothetical protein
VTRTRFNDAGPLIRLGRLEEAGRLLAECQRVFADHADTAMLAKVLSARADLEARLGHWSAAMDLERAALRLSYARPEPWDIAISHFNLAIYLRRLGSDWRVQRAHRLAGGLIDRLTGTSHQLEVTVRALSEEMRADDGMDPSLPSTVAQVIGLAEQTEGVRLGALLPALQPDPAATDAALAEILSMAAELPPEDDDASRIQTHIEQWEPVIAAIATACQAVQTPPPELTEHLDEMSRRPDWSALTAVLRRILAGDRDEATLTAGLDNIDTAIVRETLSRIAEPGQDQQTPGG